MPAAGIGVRPYLGALGVLGAVMPAAVASAAQQVPAQVAGGTLKAGTLSFDGHATVGDFTSAASARCWAC